MGQGSRKGTFWHAAIVAGLLLGMVPASSHADQVADKKQELQQAAARRQVWEQKLQRARQEVSALKAQVAENQRQLQQSAQVLASIRQSASSDQQSLQANAQQKARTLQQARSQLQSTQKSFDNQLRALTNQLAEDAKELADANQALSNAKAREADLQAQSVVLQHEIDTKNADIAAKNAALQGVLVQVYKLSRTSDLELVLSSSSFNDALEKLTLFSRVTMRDTDALDQLAKERQDTVQSQQILSVQLDEVDQLQKETEAERALIQTRTQDVHAQQDALAAQLSDAEVAFKSQEADLTAQIDAIQGQKGWVAQHAEALAAPIQARASNLLIAQQQQVAELQTAQQKEQDAQKEMEQAQHDIASISSLIAQMQAEAARQQREAEARARAQSQSSAGASTQSYLPATGNGQLMRPLSGLITQGFGPTSWLNEPSVTWGGRFYRHFHTGVDFATAYGTPIRAAASGVVWMAAWYGGYGNCIIIAHNQHLTTLYGHMSRFAVSSGQHVSQGQVIGYVGSTGNSTGPHVHFEVRVDGQFVNPFSYTG